MKRNLLKLIAIVQLFSIFSFKATSQDFKIFHHDANDSSKNYWVVYEKPKTIKGVLVLLPSFGEPAFTIQNETDIIKKAINNGLFTVSISLQDGPFSFCVDSISQQSISKAISDIYKYYHLENVKLYLGGFSIGGSGAIRYYENCFENPKLIKPSAVFAIDPPLDFVRFYSTLSKRLADSIKSEEAEYLVKRIIYHFNGSPSDNYSSYINNSPYIFKNKSSKIKLLKTAPVLLITEPDIEWQLTNRNRDFYDINALDCVSFIKELRLLNNQNATLFITSNKGYRRISNTRNPHSWSIADSDKTIAWLQQY